MPHTTNIESFRSTADGPHLLMRCYCGLVTIELVIKQEVGLSDHNVLNGLAKLRVAKAVNTKAWTAVALLALTNKLRTDLVAIQVNGSSGLPRAAPAESYPYLRYCRFDTDGWAPPSTSEIQLATLASTVQQIRTFLRTNFSLPT